MPSRFAHESLHKSKWANASMNNAYNSPRYTISALLLRSSLARVLLGPHRAFFLSSVSCSHALCPAGAGATILTKTSEHSNLRASLFTVHSAGSSARSLLISSMSSSLRWYRAVRCLYFICGGRAASEGASGPRAPPSRRRRGSFRGRNRSGVCSGDASEAGGL